MIKRSSKAAKSTVPKSQAQMQLPCQDVLKMTQVVSEQADSVFDFAKTFINRPRQAIAVESQWQEIQLWTEFSGSGCPEIMLQAVLHNLRTILGWSIDWQLVSAADKDPNCRKVLAGAGLYFQF